MTHPAIRGLLVPPHSEDAERALLGWLLVYGTDLHSHIATLRLSGEDFYHSRHRHLWDAINAVYGAGRPVDAGSVIDRLDISGKLDDIGGIPYVASLTDYAYSFESLKSAERVVSDHATLRRIINAGTEIVAAAYSGADSVRRFVEEAREKFLTACRGASSGARVVGIREVVTEAVQRIEGWQAGEDPGTYFRTGLAALDNAIGGFGFGTPAVIGARPSAGKSSLMRQIVQSGAEQGYPSLIVGIEDENRDSVASMLAQNASIDGQKLTRGIGKLHKDEWPRIGQACSRLAKLPVYFDRDRTADVDRIVDQIHACGQELGVRILIVDYIQLLRLSGFKGNRNDEIDKAVGKINDAAKQYDMATIYMSQLSRGVETRGGGKNDTLSLGEPIDSDLRDSGAIEQMSRLNLLLYRPENYSVTQHQGRDTRGKAIIKVTKQTYGQRNQDVWLDFVELYARFQDETPGY